MVLSSTWRPFVPPYADNSPNWALNGTVATAVVNPSLRSTLRAQVPVTSTATAAGGMVRATSEENPREFETQADRGDAGHRYFRTLACATELAVPSGPNENESMLAE